MSASVTKSTWIFTAAAALLLGGCQGDRTRPEEGADTTPIELQRPSIAVAHQDSLPMPPALLKRLAAAAEGYPGNGDIWLVADPDFPHDILNGFFNSEEAAATYRDSNETTFGVYGPLDTDATAGLQGRGDDMYFLYCRYSWSPYCPVPGGSESIGDVDSVRIIIYEESGLVGRSFPSDSLPDAVFFTMRAYDRYLHPYYISLYGVDRANVLRDSLFASIQ